MRDPIALDPSGLTTLDTWQPSKEGDLLAYQISEGGTEESVLRVMDVATGEIVDGPIDGVQDTDGIDVTTTPLGPAFPGGMHTPIWAIIPLAAGMATTMTPLTTLIMTSVPLGKAGVGSAMNDTTRELGGTLTFRRARLGGLQVQVDIPVEPRS